MRDMGCVAIFRCSECGSRDVRIDAWAEWDILTQRWILSETYDNAYCRDCEGETTLVEEVWDSINI